MAMPPRILLLSAIGIILYLSLSLYHGHQLNKYPLLEREGGKVLSARSEEKTWVQVSTTKQVAAGPVQPQGAQGQTGGATEEVPAGSTGGLRQLASVQEHQQKAAGEATAADDPQVILSALQAELLRSCTLLQNREEELRQANLQLERTQEEKQQAVESASRLLEGLPPIRKEQERQLVEISRLQTELKEARARAAIAEGELERARLKAEAMFRYGQEQSRLLAPSRQEVETLKTRLQETSGKLLQAEQQITDLNKREQQLRKELHDPSNARDEAKAPAGPEGAGKGATPAGARAD
jgi:hypothetical protein